MLKFSKSPYIHKLTPQATLIDATYWSTLLLPEKMPGRKNKSRLYQLGGAQVKPPHNLPLFILIQFLIIPAIDLLPWQK